MAVFFQYCDQVPSMAVAQGDEAHKDRAALEKDGKLRNRAETGSAMAETPCKSIGSIQSVERVDLHAFVRVRFTRLP
jgi:hypothetical protein